MQLFHIQNNLKSGVEKSGTESIKEMFQKENILKRAYI
jgi:hypothetical protein